jgi:hypothetical protein
MIAPSSLFLTNERSYLMPNNTSNEKLYVTGAFNVRLNDDTLAKVGILDKNKLVAGTDLAFLLQIGALSKEAPKVEKVVE